MLSPRLRVPILAAALALVASCSTDVPTGPSSSPTPVTGRLLSGNGLLGTGLGEGLLTCTPLPASRVEQTVGPEGGVVQIGPHTLMVPAGALTSPVTIAAEISPDSVNSIRFAPEGLTFGSHPARLTMSYANCSLLGQLAPKRIVYTTDLLQILQWLLSLDDPLHQRVSADVQHFSRYAIAW